jgi:hypothetical protein
MISLGMLALRYITLRGVALAMLVSIHPSAPKLRDAGELLDAIALSVTLDPTPVYGDAKLEAAAMVRWVWGESRFRRDPNPESWDARAKISCGAFQLRCKDLPETLYGQAQAWLVLAHVGAQWCPQSPLAPLSGACGGAAQRLAEGRMVQIRALVASLP